MFQEELTSRLFQIRINHTQRWFGWFTKLVLVQVKIKWKTGSGLKLVQNQFEKQMNSLPN